MTIKDIIYKSSPEYSIAYQAGFEECKRIVTKDLNECINKIQSLQALSPTTYTTDTQAKQ